ALSVVHTLSLHDALPILINIARGRLIDETALRRALESGWIGGAVLDVFREEPLPAESPLYGMPNLIITPHTSWASDRVIERTVRSEEHTSELQSRFDLVC